MPTPNALTMIGRKTTALLYALSCLFLLALIRAVAASRSKL